MPYAILCDSSEKRGICSLARNFVQIVHAVADDNDELWLLLQLAHFTANTSSSSNEVSWYFNLR